MHKNTTRQSGALALRAAAVIALLSLSALFAFVAYAATPPAGTVTPSGPNLSWVGTGTAPTGGAEDSCIEGTSCDTFKLTISGTSADWAAASKQVHVQINWTSPSTDYDLYVHKGTLTGPVVASSGSGGSTQEQVDLDPRRSNIGTGDFIVHVVYFAATAADQYHGVANVVAAAPLPAPAPAASGLSPRFENFTPPAAGPNTLGRAAGEPSIGIGRPITGHPEGRAMFQADVQTLRVTFNGCAKPLWENKPAPTSQVDFDPILWTDRLTGRTIVHLLTFAGNAIAGESSYTDTAAPGNDGDVWQPSNGAGIASGIDHQTVGGGPYAPPLNAVPHAYPNAVYYCSQGDVDASCARSDDGGVNYGPSVVTYTSQCGGIHGHVKVAPDGTVYLPNKGCGSQQAVVVSEDNGTTWEIRKIPASASAGSDPSVGVGSGGRVYFGYADADTTAAIAVSNDKGKTWSAPYDVGAAFGINNVVFPAVIAGDNDRAAFAFLGTPTAGGLQGPKFSGVWHLYVAMTYDGGATWTTVDATPNDPVQRGCVWLGGGANICRNLLDFMDLQMDQQGRVMVGYADGCAGGECIQANANATGNSYTALAAIARQSGGRRLLAASDPPDANTATVPGMPFVAATRNGGAVRLTWSEADNGGSPITAYNILRGNAAGAEGLLATVTGTTTSYVDNSATDPNTTYFYKVQAVNAQGVSCGDNEVSAKYSGSSWGGTGFVVAADPTGDQTGAPGNADLDIQSISILEPGSGPNAGRLVFNLKVADLSVMPNERMWRIIWNSQASPGSQYYVGMTKDQAGTVSFEYGTVATSTVGLVLGVQTTTKVGVPDAGSFTPNGLITIAIAKDKIGKPQKGDLLGAVTVRTYATVTAQIRSTNAIDTTSNASANDNTANAATYALVGPAPAQLLNLSTRARVQTGENVLIGGFIITGGEPKKVLLRGIGPSLTGAGVAGALQDPVLELHNTNAVGSTIATNDNWKDTQQSEIAATGVAPSADAESAIVQTLAPGAYTAVLRGKGGTSGVGLVELYDIGTSANSQLANISSRGFVDTGDNVMIAGFIVGPPGPSVSRVLVRGIGPSLTQNGVVGALADPTLELRDGNGALLTSNDNWADTQQAEVQATGIPPFDAKESAIVAPVSAGNYTAILRGKNNATGVGLVEVYAVP